MSGKATIEFIGDAIAAGTAILDRDIMELRAMQPSRPNTLKYAVASYKKIALLIAHKLRNISAVYNIKVSKSISFSDGISRKTIDLTGLQLEIDTLYNQISTDIGYFLITPINSMRNFLCSMPIIGTSVLMAHYNDMSFSVVMYDMATNLRYSATFGRGLYINGLRATLVDESKMTQAIIAVHNIADAIRFDNTIDKVIIKNLYNMQLRVGAMYCFHNTSMALAYLSIGRINAVVDLAIGGNMDIMAAIRLAAESGAVITDINGDAISVDSTTLVAAGPMMHAELIKTIQHKSI